MQRSRHLWTRVAALIVLAAAALAASPAAYGAAPGGHKMAVHADRISCAKAKRLIIREGTTYDAP
ncbi:MAG TPA: hypothetical protein VHC43_03775 [Mycobacteriales bacterium]|nr:hypothetical protein [Mycobacteriales bacterium]